MFAVCSSHWAIPASPEAELLRRHEARPLVILFKPAIVISEYQPTRWVSVTIGAMRVEFSPVVISGNADLREITDSRNLDVVWSLDEMDSLKRAIRNKPSPISWPGAPGNDLFFSYTNSGVPSIRVWRTPDAKVACAVDEDVLAL